MTDQRQPRHIAEENEILRIVNGSRLYGTNVATSDMDEMAIFVETADSVFLRGKMETVQLRDKPEGVRSEEGDRDCTSYSLRHFGHLAIGGNPSVLTLFSAPESAVLSFTSLGLALLDPAVGALFASKAAAPRFCGYMESQKKRLLGEKSGHIPKRPELVEKYGYDTKYTNHIIRLGFQGIEFMNTGRMTLPMPDDEVDVLLRVRNGEFSFTEALEMIERVEQMLKASITASCLPERPDFKGIAKLFKQMHELHWEARQT